MDSMATTLHCVLVVLIRFTHFSAAEFMINLAA